MSDLKESCPGCRAWTNEVGRAFRDGEPCPYCGHQPEVTAPPPVGALVEVTTIDGRTHDIPQLATWTGKDWQLSRTIVSAAFVKSWRRVQVVPVAAEADE